MQKQKIIDMNENHRQSLIIKINFTDKKTSLAVLSLKVKYTFSHITVKTHVNIKYCVTTGKFI